MRLDKSLGEKNENISARCLAYFSRKKYKNWSLGHLDVNSMVSRQMTLTQILTKFTNILAHIEVGIYDSGFGESGYCMYEFNSLEFNSIQ